MNTEDRSASSSPPPEPPAGTIVASAIVFEGGLALVALVVGYFLDQPPLALVQWTALGAGQGLLAAAPLALGLLAIDRLPVGPLKTLDAFVREALVPLFRGLSLPEIVLVAALAGLGEEMLFRGVAQPWLARVTGSIPVGLLLASALFGLAHPLSRTYVVLAAVIGLYFGGLLLATGNLLAPIVAHAAYDLFAIVYLLRTTPEK